MAMNESLQVTYELVQTKVQDKAAKQTEKSMAKLSGRAAATNAAISGALGAMVGATAALGGAMFLTVGAASKFEDSFAGIRKTVDASEKEFSKLAAQVRQLAQDIPVAVTQLNAIGELGGQLGVDVENLEEFIGSKAKMDRAIKDLEDDQAADKTQDQSADSTASEPEEKKGIMQRVGDAAAKVKRVAQGVGDIALKGGPTNLGGKAVFDKEKRDKAIADATNKLKSTIASVNYKPISDLFVDLRTLGWPNRRPLSSKGKMDQAVAASQDLDEVIEEII